MVVAGGGSGRKDADGNIAVRPYVCLWQLWLHICNEVKCKWKCSIVITISLFRRWGAMGNECRIGRKGLGIGFAYMTVCSVHHGARMCSGKLCIAASASRLCMMGAPAPALATQTQSDKRVSASVFWCYMYNQSVDNWIERIANSGDWQQNIFKKKYCDFNFCL